MTYIEHKLWSAPGVGLINPPVVVYTSCFYSFFYPTYFVHTILAITSRPSNSKQPNFLKTYKSKIKKQTFLILKKIQGVAGAGHWVYLFNPCKVDIGSKHMRYFYWDSQHASGDCTIAWSQKIICYFGCMGVI